MPTAPERPRAIFGVLRQEPLCRAERAAPLHRVEHRPPARTLLQAILPANRALARVRTVVTSARYAVPPTIAPRLSGASERDRVVTPYDPDAWEAALRELGLLDEFIDVPEGLRTGFPIGEMAPIYRTKAHANYPEGVKNMAEE